MNSADTPKKMLVAQMKAFFGFRPGQGTTDFGAELKALTDEEKRQFAAMLTAAGYPCEVSAPQEAATAA